MKTLKRFIGLVLISFISINVLQAQSLQVTLTPINATCNASDGGVTTVVSGGLAPYTFNWYDMTDMVIATTQDLTGVPQGRYFVSVIDANSNQFWASVVVTNGIIGTFTASAETCGNSNGTATLNVTGGTAPYSVLWNNGLTTITASGLASGFYTVDATDANGCVVNVDSSIYIQNNTPIVIQSMVTNTVCSNANGSIALNVSGGVAPYSYYWSTTPVQTGATATNLDIGTYIVTVTDATGCANTASSTVYANSGTLSAFIGVTNANCNASDGAATVVASGGTPPYTYLWSEGSTAASVTGLAKGGYHVTITDNGGCSTVKSTFVNSNSPISLSFSSTPAACNHTGGSATVTPTGGTAPYTYAWGWTNTSTTASITNVDRGYYTVLVTDANGCASNGYTQVWLDQSCINTINGTFFQDANGNCIFDAGEYPITNALAVNQLASGDSYYSYTDAQGNYTMRVETENYTVRSSMAYPHHSVECPLSGQYALNGTTGMQTFNGIDFGLQTASPVKDVNVTIYNSSARPGFHHYYTVYIQNTGTAPANGDLVVQHDANEVLWSASPAGNTYNSATQEVTFSYTNLAIGEYRYFNITTILAPTVPLSTVLVANAMVTNTAGDDVPADNNAQTSITVVGSFDPNDIAVSPAGVGPQGFITRQDDELTYHIRFQNTGTAEAYFIKVIDTLDTDLNPLTVHDVVASHDYVLTIKDGRILEFYFPDIYLPDSTTDLEGSNGFITYKVNQANTLPMGTEITNRAFIYFDYNAPVETNTVLNTITTTASVSDPAATAQLHKAYPVPTNDQLIIESEVDFESVQVMDITGRVVKSSTVGGSTFETSVRDLSPGVYFYKIYLKDAAPMTGKIVVE